MALILLVDDDHSMRHFLSKALERAGHDIVIAHDGHEALAKVKNSAHNFDLLLTDIVMPGMDGIQLSQKIVDIDPHLKVMFMTGFSAVLMDRKDLDKDTKMVSKPFHLKDLIEQVDKILAA